MPSSRYTVDTMGAKAPRVPYIRHKTMKTIIEKIAECANKEQARGELSKFMHKKKIKGVVQNIRPCEEYDNDEYDIEVYMKEGIRTKTVQIQGKKVYRIIYERV